MPHLHLLPTYVRWRTDLIGMKFYSVTVLELAYLTTGLQPAGATGPNLKENYHAND